MVQQDDGQFEKGLSVHTDFHSIKKTLHNITELKVVIFKVFIMNTNLIGVFFQISIHGEWS